MASSSVPTTAAADGTLPSTDPAFDLRNRHLANQSIHLILILSNHFTNDVHRNPYRLALLHFTDTQGNHPPHPRNNPGVLSLDTPTNLPDSEPLPWFSVDYRRLYDVLCQTVHTDQSTLLLYMLLHRNQHFKAYVISRTNIDQLVRSSPRLDPHLHSVCFLLGAARPTRHLRRDRAQLAPHLHVVDYSPHTLRR